MAQRFKKRGQQGFISETIALILGIICIPALILLLAVGGPWLQRFLGGLSGGGNQPAGNCNIGCGFDTSKINYYTQGDAPNVDATSEEARNFAQDKLNIDPSQIVAFDKSQVENLIRAEIAKQWSLLSTEQQHGATQVDAQHAILAYQYHEDSSFQMFINKNNRLTPKHDGTTIQLLSISIDKYQGNKRKEIALNWDIKYTIYTGVKENIDTFVNSASGSGPERWKQTIAIVFWPSRPNCYWTDSGSPCRSGSAQEGWNKYQNETTYNCQVSSCPASVGSNNVPFFSQKDPRWAGNDYGCGTTIGGAGCGPTSAAMVLKYYGKDVDPAKMAQESLAAGKRICGQGTSTDFFCYIANKYNLQCSPINFNQMMAALPQRPVIALTHGRPFSSDGHYIVLTGIGSDGQIMVNDPMRGRVKSATKAELQAANGEQNYWLIQP